MKCLFRTPEYYCSSQLHSCSSAKIPNVKCEKFQGCYDSIIIIIIIIIIQKCLGQNNLPKVQKVTSGKSCQNILIDCFGEIDYTLMLLKTHYIS